MEAASTAPAIGVSFQIDLGTGRTIVMQTHVDQDAGQGSIDVLLDKMGAAAERQRVHYGHVAKKEALEQLLEQQQRQYDAFSRDFMRLEDERAAREAEHAEGGRRGPYKAPPNEESQRKNARVTLENAKQDMDKTRRQIAEVGEVIAGFGG